MSIYKGQIEVIDEDYNGMVSIYLGGKRVPSLEKEEIAYFQNVYIDDIIEALTCFKETLKEIG